MYKIKLFTVKQNYINNKIKYCYLLKKFNNYYYTNQKKFNI